MSYMDRRTFLSRAASAAAFAAGMQGLAARTAFAGAPRGQSTAWLGNGGYGPLYPTAARNTGEILLALPEGFRYNVFGKEGDRMADGRPTPGDHDGMAAFRHGRLVRLVRNHEVGGLPTRAIGESSASFDTTAGGGTTTLLVDPVTRELRDDRVSLSGTLTNCAGGPTPWQTWVTCEESVGGASIIIDKEGKPTGGFAREHGYCFEVPADGVSGAPVPLKAMGRFVHEAVAVDPRTGIVYETEDRTTSGFYRFLPEAPGRLAAGGRLQMLRVASKPLYDTRKGQKQGRALPVEWVDLADPDPSAAATNPLAVFVQGLAEGGATFARLEGCWYGNGRIYINATSGGDIGRGQVWEYNPGKGTGGELKLLFESTDPALLDAPDNICVSPRGGLVLCEDADDQIHLRGLTRTGRIFDLARNIRDSGEFAGACFSPDGRTLFFNIQSPVGRTVAVWGPWENGAL
jgi:hypothetical protein